MTGVGRKRISRRGLLRGVGALAVGAAASLVTGGPAATLFRLGRPSAPGARLAAALPHSDGALRLGRVALASGLVERDAAGLVAGLVERIPDLEAVMRDGSDNDLRAALDVARRLEFAAHGPDVVRLDGWVVARTEARACALIALA